jgi:hypothetical protein
MKRILEVCSLALILLCAAAAQQPGTNSAAPPNPCTAPEQKQFDFWVGAWDLTWPGEKEHEVAHGTNRIKRILDSCVVEENFDAGNTMPLRGISVSVFAPQSSKWKQTWVDNEGGYLDFAGDFQDGQMILSRQATRGDGTKVLQRMVWKNIRPDEFDWSWESSKDGGKTWQVLWPIHYKRHNS